MNEAVASNRARMLCEIAGAALGGMMANPEWMRFAKEEAEQPSNGDVPEQFARIASLYAERTLEIVEMRNCGVKEWLNEPETLIP